MSAPIDLRLTRHGAIVLLLGMLTGFVIRNFHNRNFGNAAHLTGLIGGYGLIALGVLWPKLNLQAAWSRAGAWITALSMYLNWLGLVLQGGLGDGSQGIKSSAGSMAIWNRAGAAAIAIAIVLSLVSVTVVLIGLRPSRSVSI